MARFEALTPWRKKRLSLAPSALSMSGLIIGLVFLSAEWLYFHPSNPALGSALSVSADFVPMAIATVGIVISYKTPKKENHLRTTLILVFCGFVGTGIMTWTRIRNESFHKTEMNQLNKKMDRVGSQNEKLGNFLLAAKSAGKMSEADRRRAIEEVLRNKYILSHNPIDSEVLAGLKMPPEDWMNEQLKKMKESWTFKAFPTAKPAFPHQESPAEKQAHVVFSFFQPDMSEGPRTTEIDPMIDGNVSFSIIAMAVGDTPAENVQIWIRECKTCEWASPNPPGFPPSDTDHQFDKGTQSPELLPNVASPRWNFTVKVPQYPKTDPVAIACYYACKNCAPVNWKKPQLLWVTSSIAFEPKLQFPPIVYTPESVKQ